MLPQFPDIFPEICSTIFFRQQYFPSPIPIPNFPKILKIILRKSCDEFNATKNRNPGCISPKLLKKHSKLEKSLEKRNALSGRTLKWDKNGIQTAILKWDTPAPGCREWGPARSRPASRIQVVQDRYNVVYHKLARGQK